MRAELVATTQVVADEQAVLRQRARVDVEGNPGKAIRIRNATGVDRCGGERRLHFLDLRTLRRKAGTPVELEEDVLVHRVSAHRRQINIDDAVAVDVDPVDLPVVEEAVTVRVLADLDLPAYARAASGHGRAIAVLRPVHGSCPATAEWHFQIDRRRRVVVIERAAVAILDADDDVDADFVERNRAQRHVQRERPRHDSVRRMYTASIDDRVRLRE